MSCHEAQRAISNPIGARVNTRISDHSPFLKKKKKINKMFPFILFFLLFLFDSSCLRRRRRRCSTSQSVEINRRRLLMLITGLRLLFSSHLQRLLGRPFDVGRVTATPSTLVDFRLGFHRSDVDGSGSSRLLFSSHLEPVLWIYFNQSQFVR